jgi:iduronate 2-sulfatase
MIKYFNMKKLFRIFGALGILLIILFFNVAFTKKEPLNILFIPVDDLRPDFSVYDNAMVKTPNFDRLAANGITFNRAYCQQAVCNPSRASIMTGLRPDSLKVWDLKTDMRVMNSNLITIPQYFKSHGYTTIGLGKTFHNIFPDSLSWTKDVYIKGYQFDPDAMYVSEENIKIIEDKKQKLIEQKDNSRIDKYGYWYLKAKATESADVPDEAYYDGVQTQEAINQLRSLKKAKKPFFLSIGFYKPHLPFNAPKKYWDLYDRSKIVLADNQFIPKGSPEFAVHGDQELRPYTDFNALPLPSEGSLSEERQRELLHGYYASISYVDAQVGKIMDELIKLKLDKNTIIVLWGDHGWKLGEHNSWGKQSNYEIDTRVPLIISGSALNVKSKKSETIVELVDIFPTLTELARIPTPKYLQGSSLVPLFKNRITNNKNVAFSQFLLGRFPPRPNVPERMGYTIRTDEFRYVEWYEWKNDARGQYLANELFDHKIDPKENQNRSGELNYSKHVNELSIQLKRQFKFRIE